MTDDAELNSLKDQWPLLVQKAQTDSPFLTFEWVVQWWQSYRERLTNPKLTIVTVWDQDRLQAILPLFRHEKRAGRTAALTILQLMGTEFESSDYLDIISPPEKKRAYLKAIFSSKEIKPLLNQVDVLDFSNVTEGSALWEMKGNLGDVLHSAMYSYRTKTCPYLNLPHDFETFWNGLSKNLRSNLRRTQNKFKKQGLTIHLVQNEEEINEAIRRLFELHQMRFAAKEAQTRFQFEQRGAFHQEIAKTFLSKGWLQLYQIKDGPKLVGSLYCYKFGRSMMYVQGGFDPQYHKFAPGNIIILRAITDAIQMGLQKFDFMRGNETYKYRWATDTVHLHQILYPLSRKARIYYFYQDMLFQSKQVVKSVIKRAANQK